MYHEFTHQRRTTKHIPFGYFVHVFVNWLDPTRLRVSSVLVSGFWLNVV